ncbi:MAG: hypothetical protein ACOH1V_06555 [Stenotrophomonas sp.]
MAALRSQRASVALRFCSEAMPFPRGGAISLVRITSALPAWSTKQNGTSLRLSNSYPPDIAISPGACTRIEKYADQQRSQAYQASPAFLRTMTASAVTAGL